MLRLQRQGRPRLRRRRARRRADRGACRAAPVVPARRRRHPHRAAGQPRRGGARRAGHGADRDRAGDDDDPQGLGYRHAHCGCAARAFSAAGNPGDQYVTLQVVIGHRRRCRARRIRRGMGGAAIRSTPPRDAVVMIAFERAFGPACAGSNAASWSRWVENRWVLPEQHGDTWLFHEVDVARVELILEIRQRICDRRRGGAAGARPARPGLRPAPPTAPAVRRARLPAARSARRDQATRCRQGATEPKVSWLDAAASEL